MGADATARYDEALDRLLRYHPDVVELATELAADESDAMGQALFAYLNLLGTDPDDVAAAASATTALAAAAGTPRERAHAEALALWVAGDWHGATARLDDLVARWPTDLLGVMFGHQLAFFVGDHALLRDIPMRVLRELDPEHPHTGFVRGMAAFGLEESGHYEPALAAGMVAVGQNPDDVWAVHAVIHTHEMTGRIAAGIAFLDDPAVRWRDGNLFTVHNWWHLAIYQIEAGRPERALAIYDAEIHHPASAGIPIEMLDGSALLWRLRMDGIDTGDRFATLADGWAAKAFGEPWYAFNDLHATIAFIGAGRAGDAAAVIARLERAVDTAGSDEQQRSNVMMTADVGLPACRAVVAFAEERYDDVVALLWPRRRTFARFGGSHAQRDVLQRLLLESALRGGRHDVAVALTGERLALRDSSPYTWSQRARALRGRSEAEAAAAAERVAAAGRESIAVGG